MTYLFALLLTGMCVFLKRLGSKKYTFGRQKSFLNYDSLTEKKADSEVLTEK